MSDLRRYKALFYIIKKMKVIYNSIKLFKKLFFNYLLQLFLLLISQGFGNLVVNRKKNC